MLNHGIVLAKMKKFKITESLRSYQYIIIDADTEKEAKEKSKQSADWTEIKGEEFIPFFETIEEIK